MKKYLSISIIIFLMLLSLTYTLVLQEKYPTINIDYNDWQSKTEFGPSEHDEKGCTPIHEKQLLLNESTIKEGDKLILYVTLSYPLSDAVSKIGFDEENLVELKEGKNKIGLFYYKHQKNKIYMQSCRPSDGSTGAGNMITFNVERPSFIDSKLGFIITFLGFYILFGESLLLTKKLYKLKSNFWTILF